MADATPHEHDAHEEVEDAGHRTERVEPPGEASDGQAAEAEAQAHEVGHSSTEARTEEGGMIAGNPEAVEHLMTSKQVQGDGLETSELEMPHAEHPTTLLPSPMTLEIPPNPEELHGPDSPTTSLIESLRSQLTLLHDQSHALNHKLVSAISKHADLEDQHLQLQQQHGELRTRTVALEGEKKQWEESMNTGLYVERDQIKEEMQKLASGLVEEERRRGSAEERRIKVENEVDELAASLFGQANTMVATERIRRSQAEDRLKETENNLAAAESAIRDMQLHLQSLPSSANPQLASPPPVISNSARRLLASHLPYSEFHSFLSHLRSLRPLRESSKSLFPPPLMTALLTQPFVARIVAEDQDPTLRLDFAPDLSFFTRRTVSNAAIVGDLIVEPVTLNNLLGTSTSSMYDIQCSMCGLPVFSMSTPGLPSSPVNSQFGAPPAHPAHRTSSRFSLRPFFNASSTSPSNAPPASPTLSNHGSPHLGGSTVPTVYIFRIARPPNATPSNVPEKEPKMYPLCKTGWCLERLRATCELWYFVRTNIVHAVWHGDDGYQLAVEREGSSSVISSRNVSANRVPSDSDAAKKSSAWGLGFKLSSDRTTGWRGAFGRSSESNPSSAPNSPGISPDESKRSLGIEQETGEGKSDLGEALDLPERKMDEKSSDNREALPVPTITEEDATPEHPVHQSHVGELDDDADTESPQSKESPDATDDGFHTPEPEASDLPSEADEKVDSKEETEAAPQEHDAERPETVNLNDEHESQGEPSDIRRSRDMSVSPKPRGPRAPPMPKRRSDRASAANGTLSPPVDHHGTEGSVDEEPEASGSKEAGQSDPDSKDAPQVPSEPPANGDDDESAVDTAIPIKSPPLPKRAAPPPLPPRKPPGTPSGVINDEIADGDKRWLGPDSSGWEAKTWRQVVKLKEDMWRARVGVGES